MLLHHVCIELWDLRIDLSMLTSEPCWVLLVLKTTLHVLSGPTLLVATTSVATIFISRETIIQLCWTNIDNTATLRRSSLADMVKRKHTLAVSIDQGHSSDFYTVSPITWGKKKNWKRGKENVTVKLRKKQTPTFLDRCSCDCFDFGQTRPPHGLCAGTSDLLFFFFLHKLFLWFDTATLGEKQHLDIWMCSTQLGGASQTFLSRTPPVNISQNKANKKGIMLNLIKWRRVNKYFPLLVFFWFFFAGGVTFEAERCHQHHNWLGASRHTQPGENSKQSLFSISLNSTISEMKEWVGAPPLPCTPTQKKHV